MLLAHADCHLVLIDIQEKLLPAMADAAGVTVSVRLMADAFDIELDEIRFFREFVLSDSSFETSGGLSIKPGVVESFADLPQVHCYMARPKR